MRTLFAFAALLLASQAVPARGILGVYFDGDRNSNSRQVLPFQEFEIYVVLHGIDSGVTGVEYKLLLPEHLSITAASYAGVNPTALVHPDRGTAVGFGSCEIALVVLQRDYVIVSTLVGHTVELFDLQQIELSAYVNVQDQSEMPLWADCGQGQSLMQYEVDAVEYATLRSTSVRSDGRSWGVLKRLFRH